MKKRFVFLNTHGELWKISHGTDADAAALKFSQAGLHDCRIGYVAEVAPTWTKTRKNLRELLKNALAFKVTSLRKTLKRRNWDTANRIDDMVGPMLRVRRDAANAQLAILDRQDRTGKKEEFPRFSPEEKKKVVLQYHARLAAGVIGIIA